MTTISLIYHSGFGHTAKAAESVAVGARSVKDVTVKVFPITDDDVIQHLDPHDLSGLFQPPRDGDILATCAKRLLSSGVGSVSGAAGAPSHGRAGRQSRRTTQR